MATDLPHRHHLFGPHLLPLFLISAQWRLAVSQMYQTLLHMSEGLCTRGSFCLQHVFKRMSWFLIPHTCQVSASIYPIYQYTAITISTLIWALLCLFFFIKLTTMCHITYVRHSLRARMEAPWRQRLCLFYSLFYAQFLGQCSICTRYSINIYAATQEFN